MGKNIKSINTGQKIGTNPTIKDASALLELEASNKGLLVPRVALTSIIVAAPVTTPADALTVFNTATAGSAPNNVTPGYYYWSTPQSKWIRLLDDPAALAVEPFNVAATASTKATLNTQNIYQNGRIGIGNFSATSPIANLDVRGNARFGTMHADELSGVSVVGGNSFSTGATNRVPAYAAGALGVNNTVTANLSYAFNNYATIHSSRSVAFNFYNTINATAEASAAFGSNNTLNGASTFVFGNNNNVSSAGSAVFGYANAINGGSTDGAYANWVNTDALFQIGNAAINVSPFVRRNAFTVLKNGNIAIGVDGLENAAKPTERLDIGLGDVNADNKGSIRIRAINTAAYAGDVVTDKLVVADATGVLKTIAASTLPSANIYNTDGTLTGNRTVNFNNNSLTFNSLN
ncbi:MAG: hypothetical protein EOP51_22130, partial [Sphingobacteriales bacterium]